MNKEDVPYLRLVEEGEIEVDSKPREKKSRFRLGMINEFLDKKGLEWSTILTIGAAFTVLILFISLGIVSLMSV